MDFFKKNIPFDASIDITKSYEDGEKWYVEGYAATTDYDSQGDIITDDALKNSVKDLYEYSTVLYNHDKDMPIAVIEEAKYVEPTKDDKGGLWVKALVSKTVPDKWQQIKERVLSKFSIRGQVVEAVKEKIKYNGEMIWANIIKSLKLIEVSLVSLPANVKARTLSWYIAKSLDENECSLCEICGDFCYDKICDECNDSISKAVWTTAYINDLPDSSFAYISPGGKKDKEGKTTPRSLRHLPYKDKNGKPDAAHVRNALARLSQTDIPASAKATARRKLVGAAKKLGINVSKKSYTNDEVDALFEELGFSKGYFDEFFAPHTTFRCNGKQIDGLMDRKIGEKVKCTFNGKITALYADDEYGASGTIDVESGIILEVNKAMDIKKSDGTLYTQEEIDALVKKSEETEQKLQETEVKLSETKAKAEGSKDECVEEAEAKAEEAEAKAAEAIEANKKLAEENLKIKQENEKLSAEKKEIEVENEAEKKWASLKGVAYKEEDINVIKPILKKSLKGEVLSVEDTDMLISKKIRGSILKLGFEEVGDNATLTEDKKKELIGIAGIRIKKK